MRVGRYAIYNKKEELVFEGTALMCSAYLGITRASFFCGMTRSKSFRGGYTVIKVEDGYAEC